MAHAKINFPEIVKILKKSVTRVKSYFRKASENLDLGNKLPKKTLGVKTTNGKRTGFFTTINFIPSKFDEQYISATTRTIILQKIPTII